MRKIVALICAMVILTTVLGCASADFEDSISFNGVDYTVSVSHDYGGTAYSVYDPTAHEIGLTAFYATDAEDVFCNTRTGGDVTITFFHPYECGSRRNAEILCKYLTEHSSAKNAYSGYFKRNRDELDDIYFVYLVEGLNVEEIYQDWQPLWGRNPWSNRIGTELYLEFVNYGDVVESDWDYLWNDQLYSIALWESQNTPWGGITFGLRFSENGKTVRRYCGEYDEILDSPTINAPGITESGAVEINANNWNVYFDVVEDVENTSLILDGAALYSCDLHTRMKLKDRYADRIDTEKNNEVDFELQYKECFGLFGFFYDDWYDTVYITDPDGFSAVKSAKTGSFIYRFPEENCISDIPVQSILSPESYGDAIGTANRYVEVLSASGTVYLK